MGVGRNEHSRKLQVNLMATPKRIAILGSSGQDGTLLSKQLMEEGFFVGLFSRRGISSKSNLSETYFGDLTDFDALRNSLLEFRPDEIINFASLSSVFLSEKNPELSYRVNYLLVREVLNFIPQLSETFGKQVGFIQASSSEMFGNQIREVITENSSLAPTNTYGLHKAKAHELVLGHKFISQARAAILFNHESILRPKNFVSRKISSTVSEIALGKETRLILGNLESTRDWGYAPDYVNGVLQMTLNPDTEEYVFATGKLHSIIEFCQTAFEAVGISNFEKHLVSSPEFFRKSDTVGLVGDSSKAKTKLNWDNSREFSEIVVEMVQHDLKLLREF